MKTHELKIWPEYYQAIVDGYKTFDIRKNDRNFEVDDMVILKEWERNEEIFTGRVFQFQIQYLAKGPCHGLPEGLCVISIP